MRPTAPPPLHCGPSALLRQLFDAAIRAADPARITPSALPPPPKGRTIVVGAGKASAAMARALEQAWDGPLQGLVITRYGHAAPCQRIRIVEAAHPTPDAAGLAATRDMLALLDGLGPDDLVIALISGGGSALMTAPAGGISLADKQAVNDALLVSGAPISEINLVRKHLSAVKGGRLAARAAPAHVVALLISDVPGDDPAVIASGPTVADPGSSQEARAVLARYAIDAPASVLAWLDNPESESIKPGDARLAHVDTRIIAAPRLSLEAAAEIARRAGVTPVILGDAIEGEAAEVGRAFAGIARHAASAAAPFGRPCVLLSGGETTVTLRKPLDGAARGGRNVEFLLAMCLQLAGAAHIHALAADTDGVDGAADIAGALIRPDTLARAAAAGLDARAFLARHDGHGFFEALGDSLVTGPTLTNVNDFRAMLITQEGVISG
ncbi:glycerate kinase type-2 family protein [Camelimonas sp. ID_303_24]